MHKNRGILTPDITFLLELKPEEASKRTLKRGEDLEKFEKDKSFVQKLINAYSCLGNMAQVDESIFGKVVMIDANRTPEEIALDIKDKFHSFYNIWEKQNLSVGYNQVKVQSIETVSKEG